MKILFTTIVLGGILSLIGCGERSKKIERRTPAAQSNTVTEKDSLSDDSADAGAEGADAEQTAVAESGESIKPGPMISCENIELVPGQQSYLSCSLVDGSSGEQVQLGEEAKWQAENAMFAMVRQETQRDFHVMYEVIAPDAASLADAFANTKIIIESQGKTYEASAAEAIEAYSNRHP